MLADLQNQIQQRRAAFLVAIKQIAVAIKKFLDALNDEAIPANVAPALRPQLDRWGAGLCVRRAKRHA